MILYIDDDQNSLLAMEEIFTNNFPSKQLECWNNTARLKEKIHKGYELIILDAHMRPHDALVCYNIIKQDNTHLDIPIICISAGIFGNEALIYKNTGFNAVVTKPIPIKPFTTLLKNIFDGKSINFTFIR